MCKGGKGKIEWAGNDESLWYWVSELWIDGANWKLNVIVYMF